MTTLNDIIALQEEHEQQGGIRVGVMALWTVRDNLFVERSELEALADACNLDKKYLPSPINLSTACTRAITATRAKLQSGMLLRWIQKSSATDMMTLGLVREDVDSKTSSLVYEMESRITYGKAYGFNGNPHHSIVDDLNAHYAIFIKHTSQDIRKILTNMTDACGVALRTGGGAYYIPAVHQVTVDAVGNVVAAIDSANRLYQIPLFHTPKSAATLTELALADLQSEVTTLEKDVAELEVDKTRNSTLEERLRRFKEMERRVQTFASQLNFDSAQLLSRISTLKGEIQALNVNMLASKMNLAKELGVR